MNRELIARVAHEINRGYCASLGDLSQPAWQDAADSHQASILAGVDMHLANPDATPEQSHEAWLAQKTADGWKYGETKDAKKKEHPCFRPYAELPPEQRAKDYLFRATVHALKDICEAPVAGVSAPVTVDAVAVKYIGARQQHKDGIYGTGHWVPGQSRMVAAFTAKKMLTHPDVYVPGEVESATPLPSAADGSARNDEDPIQDLRDSVAAMDKVALEVFAKTHYQVDLDKRRNVDALRTQVTQLIDQFGVI